MIKVSTEPVARICQGDVFRNVEYFESIAETDDALEIRKILFPLAVVLTQDCDLAQDHTFRVEQKKFQDKRLISVLIAPAYNAEHFFAGHHLSELGVEASPVTKNKTDGEMVIQNQNPRFHYLEFPEGVPLVTSVVDFKHYFSAPMSYLTSIKEENFVCKIAELYREDISHRFAAFLSRIGLPTR